MEKRLELLVQDLREGKIEPEAALDAADCPAVGIGSVPFAASSATLASGFTSLDSFGVLKSGEGELVILAARPSIGKSALAFNIARCVAECAGPVLAFSLEMSARSIQRRLVADKFSMDLKKLDEMSEGEVNARDHYLKNLPLYVVEQGSLSVDEAVGYSKAFAKRRKPALIIVDYLQLMRSREMGNRNNEIGEITGGLKSIAKDIGCPVLALSQVNRACETRGRDPRGDTFGNFMPVLSDLRDSGNIEQDADVVAFVTRPAYYGVKGNEYTANVSIAKNRNGETGETVLHFYRSFAAFRDPKAG